MAQQKIIDELKAHAVKNYDKNGWDYLVECYEDADIAEVIGNASTLRGAIAKIGPELRLKDEMRLNSHCGGY